MEVVHNPNTGRETVFLNGTAYIGCIGDLDCPGIAHCEAQRDYPWIEGEFNGTQSVHEDADVVTFENRAKFQFDNVHMPALLGNRGRSLRSTYVSYIWTLWGDTSAPFRSPVGILYW